MWLRFSVGPGNFHMPWGGGAFKKSANELIRRTETDSQTLKNLWLPKGIGGVGGGTDWGFWTVTCMVRCME